MATLTLSYYDSYSVEFLLDEEEYPSTKEKYYKLKITRSDFSERKPMISSVEYFLSPDQLKQLSSFIMEQV